MKSMRPLLLPLPQSASASLSTLLCCRLFQFSSMQCVKVIRDAFSFFFSPLLFYVVLYHSSSSSHRFQVIKFVIEMPTMLWVRRGGVQVQVRDIRFVSRPAIGSINK